MRLLRALRAAACTCMRPCRCARAAASITFCLLRASWTAVCCRVLQLQQRRGRQVQLLCCWLRAEQERHVRTGAPASSAGRCGLHAHEALSLRTCCCDAHQASCLPPGSQCAAHCDEGCGTAGAGKCDKCAFGYGLTKSGTCAPVRLLRAQGAAACTRMRPCRCACAAESLSRPLVCPLDRSALPTAFLATKQGPASATSMNVIISTVRPKAAPAHRCACSEHCALRLARA